MSDAGHRYDFGPPAGGWPDFDEAGRRIRTETQKPAVTVVGCRVPGHPINHDHEHDRPL